MIEKTYRCDLCGDIVLAGYREIVKNGWRLKWEGLGITLCHLGDSQASEKIVCNICLSALKETVEP